MMQNLQQSIVASGLVSQAYNISADLMPIMAPVINNLLQPYLEKQLAQLPDESIPALARDVLAEAEKKGSMSIMDGFLTLEAQDIQELRQLVEKNLPMADRQGYEVII
jgi:hypothetical protein